MSELIENWFKNPSVSQVGQSVVGQFEFAENYYRLVAFVCYVMN